MILPTVIPAFAAMTDKNDVVALSDEERAMSRQQRDVHGILLFDKPQGLSSNQALQSVRRLYGAAKAGHTGSLDPLATGLLPLCFGEATKIAGLLLGSRKAYACECRLGTTTDTDDADGRVVETRPVSFEDDATILSAMASLTGRITQVPPAYSAIKRDGERMYQRARRGEIVEPPPREVDVYRFDLIARGPDTLRIEVECGSGTYVRSLVRDLGARLGCGAHVISLRRLWVEPFMDPGMHTLDDLREIASRAGEDALDAILLPLERGLAGHPTIVVGEQDAERLRQGQPVFVENAPDRSCIALDAEGRAVAIVQRGPDGCLRSRRGFNPVQSPKAPIPAV